MAELFDILFGPGPEEKPKEKTSIARPAFVKRGRVNVDQWFDVDALWKHVTDTLKSSSSSEKVEIPVVQLTQPGVTEDRAAQETAYFFGKEGEIASVDTRTAWDRILGPFLDEVTDILNSKKPAGLPGKLKFDVAPDSSLTLFYVDR